MSELKQVGVAGHSLGVLKLPPPHLMFLASKSQSEPTEDSMVMLSRAGGLAALVVRTIDGEEVVNERRLPRTLDELSALGQGFIMAAWDVFESYDAMGEVFTAVLASYSAGEAPNPT